MIHEALPEEKKDIDLYAFWRVMHFYKENKIRLKVEKAGRKNG